MTRERHMRAAVLRSANQPLTVEQVVLAPPGPGEVLARVVAAGVCHSDVHLADGSLGDGRWPIVLGHEGAGVVEAVGPDVGTLVPGDPVAFCFVPSCGSCRHASRAGGDSVRPPPRHRGPEPCSTAPLDCRSPAAR